MKTEYKQLKVYNDATRYTFKRGDAKMYFVVKDNDVIMITLLLLPKEDVKDNDTNLIKTFKNRRLILLQSIISKDTFELMMAGFRDYHRNNYNEIKFI